MSFPDTPRLTVSPIAEAAQRQALRDLRPPGHPGRSLVLNNLANLLCWRVEQCGDLDPLDEAIDLYRQALDLRPPGHPHRSTSLNQLARALKTRFKRLGDLDSLAETVELHREVLLLSPPEYSTRSTCLANLAIALQAKFEQLGCLDSLTEAVDLHRQALHLRTPEHPGRSESLNNLGAAMELQFEQNGDPALLAEAVELHRQALYLRPLGHRNRSKSLNNLAIAVVTRFNQFGDFDSLAEAAQLHRQALELRPLGHPDHSTSLINLATVVITQFRQLGDLDLLAEAIDLHRQTLDLHPPGHPHRSTSLNNLAAAVTIRFRERGDLGSLEDAVQLYHQALELRPLGHHDRSTSLDNLASAMITRFKKLGNLESLAEAIDLHRQALDLRPQGHPNRSTSLCNLANAVKIRFKQLGDLESLAEAVRLHRQALELRPPGHPERSASLHNLAAVLETRFRHLVDLDNGHAARSLQDGDSDLDEALGLNKEGLELCPDGHPRRMEFLFSIGKCMLRPETHVFDFEKAIRHILEGLQDRTSPAGQTLAFGIYTLPMIEAAYELSTKLYDIFEIGRHYYDDLVLQVYVLVIQLLPRAASFGLDHLDRLNKLSRAETVSRDAATRAIAAGQNAEAVEFLEEGRGVFWSQALRLRATDLDLVSAEDSQELRRLFQLLEHWNIPDESISVVQRERHTEERRRLSSKAEALITDIRSRPGMGRFLLPPAFVSMVQSLPEGFFVFLNVSELGHHALVLDGSAKAPYNIPLKLSARLVGTKHKSPKQNPSQIKAEGKDILENNSKQTTAFSEEEKLRAGGVRERATFEDTLADLWVSIVKPIIDLLQLKKSNGRERPRVWWCTTGKLTFLPIHAAGGYTKSARERSGACDECASDYIVSSYISSISALVRARGSCSSMPRIDVKGLLIHEGSPGRSGWPSIPKVKEEVRLVTERFAAAGASMTVTRPTLPDALASLEDARMHVLHLACHGEQKSDPLASGFILRDKDLTIQDLMKLELKHGSLAFLNACQTAKGIQDQPDQAVHLAASMLFCGFKSVIATIRGMTDADGPVVADLVYEVLFKEDVFDLNIVPYALDNAVQRLRERKINAERWSVFVHMGA